MATPKGPHGGFTSVTKRAKRSGPVPAATPRRPKSDSVGVTFKTAKTLSQR